MDVPSWHPANSDAARRQAMSAPSKRTEFMEMATSTEAEREMVAREESALLGGGRGLLDPSDRLYLVEQTRLEHEAKSREQIERRAALQTFRSNALKAKKPVVATSGKKSLLSPEKEKKKGAVVVVKAKKRSIDTAEKETKAKKTKVDDRSTAKAGNVQKEGDSKKSSTASTTTSLLLQGYSSSSDEE